MQLLQRIMHTRNDRVADAVWALFLCLGIGRLCVIDGGIRWTRRHCEAAD